MDWQQLGNQSRARRIAAALRPVKPAIVVMSSHHARLSRWYAARAHEALFVAQWAIPPTPEWFDHDIDSYYTNLQGADDLSAQRGVFARMALESAWRDRAEAGESGPFRVLDLCVGDGSTPARYLVQRADDVLGVDFDPGTVRHARSRYGHTGVAYELGDIRESIPEGPWDLIVWDAAIEHFTLDETASILRAMRSAIQPWGRLCGYTLQAAASGSHLEHHEHEYANVEELGETIRAVFKCVSIFEIPSSERINWYFTASCEVGRPMRFAYDA
jgi:ubiquinone/menaquinone biosynthesis C-methylase UbiE